MKSLNIETESHGKPRNPYGPGGSAYSTTNTARTYLMFGLALFVIYFLGTMLAPSDKSNDKYASKGDAAGGWGSEHNHPVQMRGVGSGGGGSNPSPGEARSPWNTPVTHYHENPAPSPSSFSAYESSNAELEIRESDLLQVLSPIVFIPSHSRPEYKQYQGPLAPSSSFSEEVLYDKNTPHGMAFDFLLNRDTRPISHDDSQMIQRFVLTLLFYATGGKDENTQASSSAASEGIRRSGWDSDIAHFLTGLHECHWVKKSIEDQFWGILSIDSDTERRVGVTKCNDEMEVTELRL
ncbi:hypothetical protein ACHAXR_009868, partial [Thalassiosira sp. AJA248-18]